MREVWCVALALACLAPTALASGLSVPELPTVKSPAKSPEFVTAAVDETANGGRPSATPPVDAGIVPPATWQIETDPTMFLVAAALGGAFLVTGGLVLGTRYLTREDVLRHDVRSRILEYLKARSGASLKQITDDLSLTTTNAIWHLRKLEDAEVLRARRFNGLKIFYPAEGGVEARRVSLAVAALANPNAREIFGFVILHPGAHQREIARTLAVNHGTVRWHLKKLASAEIVAETRVGKAATYHATDLGRTAASRIAEPRPAAPSVVAA